MFRLEERGSWFTIQLAVKFLYSSPLYFAGEDWSPSTPPENHATPAPHPQTLHNDWFS